RSRGGGDAARQGDVAAGGPGAGDDGAVGPGRAQAASRGDLDAAGAVLAREQRNRVDGRRGGVDDNVVVGSHGDRRRVDRRVDGNVVAVAVVRHPIRGGELDRARGAQLGVEDHERAVGGNVGEPTGDA